MSDKREPRALLTDREIDAVVDAEDVDTAVKRTLLNRIKHKIETLEDDIELLRKHRPDLAKKIVDTVTEPDAQERTEHDIRTLAFKINRIERELGIEPRTRVSDLATHTGIKSISDDYPDDDCPEGNDGTDEETDDER